MNAKDFDKIVGARLNWCEKTLCAKGDEYAREGDRLWNFKAAGRKRNQHPAQALAGMEVKHDVSVDDIIDGLARGIVPPKELVAEKIGDSINYLLLLEGLIEEERQKREERTVKVEPRQAASSEQETCGVYTSPPLPNDNSNPLAHVVPDRTLRSVDDATASQMYERHKREMEQYRSND
jgi:hypothetical protein